MKKTLIASLSTLVLFGAVQAADKNWTNTADLSLVMTGGNSETENLSLSNKFVRTWDKLELTFGAKAIRAEATAKTPFYDPTSDSIVLAEATEKTAESYELVLKTKGDLVGNFKWYVNTGWFQDELAGVDSRVNVGGGFGYNVFDNETHKLATEFGFDYTDETPVDGESDSFGGIRAFLDYARPLSENSKFAADAEVLSNLDNSDDLRSNINLGLSSNLNSILALKLGYSIKYDGDPAKAAVDGTTKVYEFDTTDTVLSMSLVLNL